MPGEMITARMNAKLRPMDRGQILEDPLNEILESNGIGKVTGGGSQLGVTGEIVFCDLEIEAKDSSDETLNLIVETLTRFCAPKGSKLIFGNPKREIPFGENEGLAVYLNGTDLPKEVYETSDVNFVFSEFDRLLAPHGQVYSYFEGATETALYMYGPSFQTMKDRLAEFIASYPLCKSARVEQIA